MKVIDLLNKIANEDEIPEKIKYENYIYWYDKDWKDYKNAQVEFRSYLISSRYHKTNFLNEEVEIIEDIPKEDKKIKKIDNSEARDKIFTYDTTGSNLYFLSLYVQHNIVGKINEIIDKINGEENERNN